MTNKKNPAEYISAIERSVENLESPFVRFSTQSHYAGNLEELKRLKLSFQANFPKEYSQAGYNTEATHRRASDGVPLIVYFGIPEQVSIDDLIRFDLKPYHSK